MGAHSPKFSCRLAETPEDRAAAHRLRYGVFVAELGADGPGVNHLLGQEIDRFDPFADHLILVDDRRAQAGQDHVVGLYRLLTMEKAAQAGQFYSEDEYDLSPLRSSGRRVLELGRSCLHADYRGGMAMMHLWIALAGYIEAHDIEILFGVASFRGTDIQALAAPLSLLHHLHLAPPALRVRAHPPHGEKMDFLSMDQIDRTAAMRATPALIKAYLRLGGCVGEGAYVDHGFNTTDVCLVMDTAEINARQRALYTRDRR